MISFTSTQLAAWISVFLWPFIRVLAMLSIAPVLGHQSIPARVKIGLAASIALIIGPTLPEIPASAYDGWNALNILMQQMAIGLVFGFILRLVFAGIELAGDLVGLQMGLSFATFVDPQNSTQAPLLGSFLGIIASLVFLAINGHLMLIAGIVDSFRAFPVGMGENSLPPVRGLIGLGGEVARIGLHLALPVVTTMLICNIALGVLTRAAPQLNLLSVGFPISLLAGLWALATGMPWTTQAMQGYLQIWPSYLPWR